MIIKDEDTGKTLILNEANITAISVDNEGKATIYSADGICRTFDVEVDGKGWDKSLDDRLNGRDWLTLANLREFGEEEGEEQE